MGCPPDPPEDPGESLQNPRQQTPGVPQFGGFQLGEACPNLPRRWGITRRTCHYGFVRNRSLRSCLIYSLNRMYPENLYAGDSQAPGISRSWIRQVCSGLLRSAPALLFPAELSHSLKVSDRRRIAAKSSQNRSESLCAGLWGTVPDILGLVGPSFRSKSGSKLKIPRRILKSCRGPFRSGLPS